MTPLVLLLSPFAMAAAPLLGLHPRARGSNPWRMAWIIGGLLLSLRGMYVDVETPRATVSIRIY